MPTLHIARGALNVNIGNMTTPKLVRIPTTQAVVTCVQCCIDLGMNSLQYAHLLNIFIF